VAVPFLDDGEIVEHGACIRYGPGCEQSARRFHQIARPDQMIAAKVVIALAEAPGDGKAGNDGAGGIVPVGGEHAGADAVPVQLGWIMGLVERQQPGLPLPPAAAIMFQRRLDALFQAEQRTQGRLLRLRAETDGDQRPSLVAPAAA